MRQRLRNDKLRQYAERIRKPLVEGLALMSLAGCHTEQRTNPVQSHMVLSREGAVLRARVLLVEQNPALSEIIRTQCGNSADCVLDRSRELTGRYPDTLADAKIAFLYFNERKRYFLPLGGCSMTRGECDISGMRPGSRILATLVTVADQNVKTSSAIYEVNR